LVAVQAVTRDRGAWRCRRRGRSRSSTLASALAALALASLAGSARADAPAVPAAATPGAPLSPFAPSLAPPLPPEPPDEGRPRLSLPTESDREAWLRGGFRLGIGLHYGRLIGLEGTPTARLIGATLHLGMRLDADWSIVTSFQYSVAGAGMSGLRFSGTLDPTWHATRHLSLAVGLGFGGISGGSTGRPDVAPLPNTLDSSYTFPSSSPTLPSCTGGGVVGLARAEWSVVLGSRSSTNVALEGFGQWTGCEADTGLVEPDTGQSIVRRQWWPQVGVTGSWGIMWR
jgi:hypothetical protein